MMLVCALLQSGREILVFFFFQAEDGIRDLTVTGVQTCALPISSSGLSPESASGSASRAASGAGVDGRGRGWRWGLRWLVRGDLRRFTRPPPRCPLARGAGVPPAPRA